MAPARRGQTTKRRYERRLRKTVRRFAGCFGQLPARHRKVLSLRAGFGSEPVSTRRRVGQRLDVSAVRVARIERRGLRVLRTLGRDGGCGAAATTTATAAGAAAATTSDGESQPPAASGAEVRTVATDRTAGLRSAAGGDSDGSGNGGGPMAFLPPLPKGASDWWYSVLLLGLVLLGWALRRELGAPARA